MEPFFSIFRDSPRREIRPRQHRGDGLSVQTQRPVTEIRVRDFSDLSVRFEHWSDEELLYETVMVQGSPYVYVYPEDESEFRVRLGRFEVAEDVEELEVVDDEKRVLVDGYETYRVDGREVQITAKRNEPLVFGVYSGEENRAEVLRGARVEMENVWADYGIVEGQAVTRYSARTPWIESWRSLCRLVFGASFGRGYPRGRGAIQSRDYSRDAEILQYRFGSVGDASSRNA